MRPPDITDAKNPEDPQNMDSLLKLIGATVRNWSFKTDCCGGSLSFTRPDIAQELIRKLLDMAREAGADCIVTSCPMCHDNLDSWQKEISEKTNTRYHIPVFYFTELMGLAFAIPSFEEWLKRHSTDPKPLLEELELL